MKQILFTILLIIFGTYTEYAGQSVFYDGNTGNVINPTSQLNFTNPVNVSAYGGNVVTTNMFNPYAFIDNLPDIGTAGFVQQRGGQDLNGWCNLGKGTNGIFRYGQFISDSGQGNSSFANLVLRIYIGGGNNPTTNNLVFNAPLALLAGYRYMPVDFQDIRSTPLFEVNDKYQGSYGQNVEFFWRMPFVFTNGCSFQIWDIGNNAVASGFTYSEFEYSTNLSSVTNIPFSNYHPFSSMGSITNGQDGTTNYWVNMPTKSHGSILGYFTAQDGKYKSYGDWLEQSWVGWIDGSQTINWITSGGEDGVMNGYYYASGVFTTPNYGTTVDSNPGGDTGIYVAYRILSKSEAIPFTNGIILGHPIGGNPYYITGGVNEDFLAIGYSDTQTPLPYLTNNMASADYNSPVTQQSTEAIQYPAFLPYTNPNGDILDSYVNFTLNGGSDWNIIDSDNGILLKVSSVAHGVGTFLTHRQVIDDGSGNAYFTNNFNIHGNLIAAGSTIVSNNLTVDGLIIGNGNGITNISTAGIVGTTNGMQLATNKPSLAGYVLASTDSSGTNRAWIPLSGIAQIMSQTYYYPCTSPSTFNGTSINVLPSFANGANNILCGLERATGNGQPNLYIPNYVFNSGTNIVTSIIITSTNAATWTYNFYYQALTNNTGAQGCYSWQNNNIFTCPSGTNTITYWFTNSEPIPLTNVVLGGAYLFLSGIANTNIYVDGGTFRGQNF